MKIVFLNRNERYSIELLSKNLHVFIDYPVELQMFQGRKLKARYSMLEEKDGKYIARATVYEESSCGLEITDEWFVDGGNVRVNRRLCCITADKDIAVRWTMNWRCKADGACTFDDYQIVVPGSFYNKNDTDNDGMDDYLGTFSQDYKDDRNPSLSVTAFSPASQICFALIRADTPKHDTTIRREQIKARHFVHDTDIGSLGFSPSEYRTDECLLRCDYPFYERSSFCLNVDGSEWAVYKKMTRGVSIEAAYLFYIGSANTLTEASWKVTKFQMDRIMNPEVPLPFSLGEAREARREMLFDSFRSFEDKKGAPAGFCVHFSPRKSYGKYNIFEYGFSGAQAMVSYAMLNAYADNGNREYLERAVKTLDFFVRHCIAPSGLPHGIYDVDKEEFIYWWTGILFPFQYSSDRDMLANFLGEQIVDSLIDIAKELEKVQGNYCRSMCETVHYLLLCYEKELADGREHRDWLKTISVFCDKLLDMQDAKGYWYRAYTMEGEPIKHPAAWFGACETEFGSGTIFPVEVLIAYYRLCDERKYLDAALRGAEFIRREYVDSVRYLGGLNDTTHIKSVKIDAVGVMYAMRSMLMGWEESKRPELLLGARDAARILATWTYIWDIPFDPGTLLGRYGFKTTGWTGCDVIPACSYVDNEFPEFVPDLMKVAEVCKDRDLMLLARIVTRGMHHGLSMPQRMYDYAMTGVQTEGYLTSLWLSDTGRKEFSGAAAKNKGDDNDTCNGIINAQALYNLDWIYQKYGTFDFDLIIEKAMA